MWQIGVVTLSKKITLKTDILPVTPLALFKERVMRYSLKKASILLKPKDNIKYTAQNLVLKHLILTSRNCSKAEEAKSLDPSGLKLVS